MKIDDLHSAASFRPVSVDQIRRLDGAAIHRYGIPGAVLMENAGRAVAKGLQGFTGKRVALFCGGGNNGGDGLVAARHLANAGYRVRLVLAKTPRHFKGDVQIHWRPIKMMKIPYILFQTTQKLIKFTQSCQMAVDSLLGTGARIPLGQPYGTLVTYLNSKRWPLLAVDVPSGLDADSGQAKDQAVRARVTVTMGLPKQGLVKPRAQPFVGRLWVADIGYPIDLVASYMANKG